MVNNKVQGQSDFVLMENVELRVREGGNKRAKETGQRNVHAFCIGTILSFEPDEYKIPKNMIEIDYNPFDHESFVVKSTQKPIYEARLALLIDEQLWVLK